MEQNGTKATALAAEGLLFDNRFDAIDELAHAPERLHEKLSND